MKRRKLTISIVILALVAITQPTLASLVTYNFTQTGDFLGRQSVTGSITIEEGIFVNQAAADILNSAQYSINMISDVTSEIFTFTPDNSEWFFTQWPSLGDTSITLNSDGDVLKITVAVTLDDPFSMPYGELILTNGDSLFGGDALFRYIGTVHGPFFFSDVEFMRQGNAIISTGGSRDLFLSVDHIMIPFDASFPFTTEFTYSYPAIDTDSDGDGIFNDLDNCPSIYNPEQSDLDSDGIGDDCDTDRDGDDISNDIDNCPDENSLGQDADADGCIDTIDDMPQVIIDLNLPKGNENSLIKLIDSVQKSLEKDNIQAAINQLEAFINKVTAQSGKKIPVEDADMLIQYTTNLINAL